MKSKVKQPKNELYKDMFDFFFFSMPMQVEKVAKTTVSI